MFTNESTDKVHDHTTLGFHRGCLACAQLEADFARASTTWADGSPRPQTVSGNPERAVRSDAAVR